MKARSIQTLAAALSCASMLLSPAAVMAAPPTMAPADVALHDGGVLVGQILDDQGVAVAMAPVAIMRADKEIAQTQTNQQGEFTVPGLQGGVYQIAAAGQQGVYRFWAPRTAPPAAQQQLQMVSADVVRGQFASPGPFHAMANWVSQHPILTGAAIAAAIAIPIAVDNNNSPSS